MANSSKRKFSSSKPSEIRSTADLLIESSSKKKRRLSSVKTENESSTDSFSYSNCVPSDSEESSESEFEEHPYSRPTSQSNKRLQHSRPRPRPKSDLNVHISQLETHIKGSNKSRCPSKNAVMARLNRLKKKKYIEDLEEKNAELEAENQLLKNMLEMRVKEVESLKRKTLNLENVIINRTEIGSLLKCVQQHTDLEISSSLIRSGPNNSPINEVEVHLEKASSSDLNELETPPSEEEALVAAVLWGMALHTFCQPYKPRTLDIFSPQMLK